MSEPLTPRQSLSVELVRATGEWIEKEMQNACPIETVVDGYLNAVLAMYRINRVPMDGLHDAFLRAANQCRPQATTGKDSPS